MFVEAHEGALPAAAVSISLGRLSEPFVLELHERAVSSLRKAYGDEGLFAGTAFVLALPTPRHLDQAGLFKLEVLTHQPDLGAVLVVAGWMEAIDRFTVPKSFGVCAWLPSNPLQRNPANESSPSVRILEGSADRS